MANVAIIYYSSTGTNFELAKHVAKGVEEAGSQARIRLVEENVPKSVIEGQEKWKAFHDAHKDEPKASHDDLLWADAVVFGTPTRYGNVAAQLKAFIDSTGPLWFQGKLADKVYAGFTSAQNPHGGQETTLLALYNSLIHFGGVLVPPGYNDPSIFASGGNPYGASVTTGGDPGQVSEEDGAAAKFLGKRVATMADKLIG